jgi:hypothetical protein
MLETLADLESLPALPMQYRNLPVYKGKRVMPDGGNIGRTLCHYNRYENSAQTQ